MLMMLSSCWHQFVAQAIDTRFSRAGPKNGLAHADRVEMDTKDTG